MSDGFGGQGEFFIYRSSVSCIHPKTLAGNKTKSIIMDTQANPIGSDFAFLHWTLLKLQKGQKFHFLFTKVQKLTLLFIPIYAK